MEWLNNVNPLSNEMGCGGVGCSAFCAKISCFVFLMFVDFIIHKIVLACTSLY